MAAFNVGSLGVGSAAQELCDALRRRDKLVEVSAVRSFETVLMEAYRLDPRLAGSVAGWQGKQSGSGPLGMKKTYRLELEYQENVVPDVKQVVLDDGKWVVSDALRSLKEIPACFQVVTKNVNELRKRLDGDFVKAQEIIQGLRTYNYQWSDTGCDGYFCVWVKLSCVVDKDKYNLYATMARREVERAARQFFGSGAIPPVIRVYLAFSYLQQTCAFDQEMDELFRDEKQPELTRPWACLSYGPLVKKTGTSVGISAAFKEFMDFFGIKCQIVHGQLNSEESEPHCWNIVCLNDKYYHVDCTYGISGSGIYIGAFMKDDISMSETHLWDTAACPVCDSQKLDFDFIEDYVNTHVDALIRLGVEEAYLCPLEIRE